MYKFGSAILMAFVISLLPFVSLVSADLTPISINIIAIQENTSMADKSVFYSITNVEQGFVIQTRDLTDSAGRLTLDLDPGIYEFELGVDFEGTEGFDYFGESLLTVRDEEVGLTVGVQPVGGLVINFIDRDGNPVTDTTLRINCRANYGMQETIEADRFGFVRLDYLPVGQCEFRATAQDFFISYVTDISQGQRENIALRFDEVRVGSRFNGLLVFSFLSLFVGLGIGAFLFYKFGKNTLFGFENNRSEEVKANNNSDIKDNTDLTDDKTGFDDSKQVNNSQKELSDVKKGILLGLRGREKKVVKYLLSLEDEGERLRLSQAKLVRGTGIPKTSLARIVDSLSSKDILDVEKVGKLKKIGLSDFFYSQ